MGSASRSPQQIISLPKGGGALHGIGEKFSPDLHTGTGNFTVPIAIPPGRNGFQPQLNLVYSTGQGNGPFGLGWSLSVPAVSRKTSKGVPLYDDETDTFLLSGAEDLVPVAGSAPGTVRYRPRTEGLFARISHYHDASNNYWEVRSKDGLVSIYGTPRPADAAPDWQDPAVIADPDHPTHIFAWKLTLTSDPFGNRIEYLYERDTTQIDGPHHWDQCRLSEIRYVDYGDPARPQFLVTMNFTYEDRPDHFSDYRAGFEIRTIRRCTQIAIFTHADEERLVRTYHLVYLDQRGFSTEQLPLNAVSLLSQVRMVGHDGTTTEDLPPLEFGYSRFEPNVQHFLPCTGPDMPPSSLSRPGYELVDLFGNGLPDVLEMDGTVRYWRNLGQGRFDLPREMPTAPAGVSLADKGVQLIDANGDGRIDLLVSTERLSGYYPLQFGGSWDRRSFQRYRLAPSFDLKDPEVRLVDLDGDGITDVIRSGSRLECFFNDQCMGWTAEKTRYVERVRDLDVFPDVDFADTRVKWADMTGDGLQDIVLVSDGSVGYWPNKGYGNWGKRISMRDCPRFPYNYDPRRILFGDLDGDGLADLVYVDDTKVTLWINQSGNRWSDPLVIEGTPSVTDMDAVRLVDLLGTGVSGVLWSRDLGTPERNTMFFLDFTGGTKPYLLHEMDNHMGAITRVGYAPSTQSYLADEQQLKTRWDTPLPFPVQVVARVEVIDVFSQGKLTTEYRYHHGYWDGVEREFRGFGMTEHQDSECFEDYRQQGLHGEGMAFVPVTRAQFSPPTLTKTWFHQGPIVPRGNELEDWAETDFSSEFWPGDPQVLSRPQTMTDFLQSLPRPVRRDALRSLRGHILRTELYALDGSDRQERPYTITEHLFGVCAVVDDDIHSRLACDVDELPPAWSAETTGQGIFFPHTLSDRTTQWERGDEPMTQFTFTGDYDAYGQPCSKSTIAVPRGRDFRVEAPPGEPYLATYQQTAYASRDDAQRYIVDRVARATSYEIVNDGTRSVRTLQADVLAGTTPLSLIGQTLSFYDGPAFEGLPFGQIGGFGALVRTENLVLTEEILHEAYKSSSTASVPPEIPPYLVPDGTPPWSDEYPQEFRDLLPALAGYTYQAGGTGSEYATGYFTVTERRRYDFQTPGERQQRGMINVKRDPLGHDTTITYDDLYVLLPTGVTDAVGLTTRAHYDFRELQPDEVTDVNNNCTSYAYSPLGLVQSIAVMGKQGEEQGDTHEHSSTLFHYDLMAYEQSLSNNRQPIFVHVIKRVEHYWDLIHEENARRQQHGQPPLTEGELREFFPDDEVKRLPERFIQSRQFSDGFGRLLQTRAQAEDVVYDDPALGHPLFGDVGLSYDPSIASGDAVGKQNTDPDYPYVAVSGWQTYDNKGQVVEKYEPFFSSGWEYMPSTATPCGQKITLYYDPRGHVICTVNPDHTERWVIYGIPVDLTQPKQFNPSPWETYTYDANDNAGRTHANMSKEYWHHWNTPSNAIIDALGRTIETIERNRAKPASGEPLPPIEEYHTHSTYDLRGNLLIVKDALDRVVFRHTYDLANQLLRVESIDAGVRHIVVDAAGNKIERRDSKGALILHAYDALDRLIRLWARDGTDQVFTLREYLTYGDISTAGLTLTQAREANLQGKLYKHYNEAGLLTFEAYDFKGNFTEKVQQVISDEQILGIFDDAAVNDWQVQAYRVNWQSPDAVTIEHYANSILDAFAYRTTNSYDALNRVKAMSCPQDVDSMRKELRPHYNRAGALEYVEVDGLTSVKHIAYNAKGQRTLIAYGNGVMTRYAYDVASFHLIRMRTEHYTQPDKLIYHSTGAPLQDIAYEYDLHGNIMKIRDRTPESGIPNTLLGINALDRTFTYDPLYRLFTATGRECDIPLPPPLWDDAPRCTDPTRTRGYTETYHYDAVGNMMQMQHHLADGNGFTREFTLTRGKNSLATMRIDITSVYDYSYDSNGNLIQETTSRHFEWDYTDRMRVYRTQTGTTEPPEHAHYLYDASGQRVKKLVRKQGGLFVSAVFIEGVFEYHRLVKNGTTYENNTLHVMDNQKRIALVRIGNPFPRDDTPAVKYHLADHLGSSNVVIDGTGALVNREEYAPYGETSFGSFVRKRYRFTGKERDKESGLYYFGARYYAPWLGRWISVDPLLTREKSDKWPNSYYYGGANPLFFVDPSGGRIIVGEDSKIKAQAFVDMIHNDVRIPQSIKAAIQVSRKNANEILVLPKIRWKKENKDEPGQPDWFKALITASTSKDTWILTTANTEVEHIKKKDFESGNLRREDTSWNRMLPDLKGVKPGWMTTNIFGENKWEEDKRLGMSTEGKVPQGIVVPSKNMVVGGKMSEEDKRQSMMPEGKPGLILISNRMTVKFQEGGSKTLPMSVESMVNVFFHELALHAGAISMGMDPSHKSDTIKEWLEQINTLLPDPSIPHFLPDKK